MSEVLLDWICKRCKTVNPEDQIICKTCQRKRTWIERLDRPTIVARILLGIITVWHLYRCFFYESMMDWYYQIPWYQQMIWWMKPFASGGVFRALAIGGVVSALIAQLKLDFAFRERYKSIVGAFRSVWETELICAAYIWLVGQGKVVGLIEAKVQISFLWPVVVAVVGILINKIGIKMIEIPAKQKKTGKKWRDPRKPIAITLGVIGFWHIIRVVSMVMEYETDNIMFIFQLAAVVLCGLAILFLIKEKAYGFRQTVIMVAFLSAAVLEIMWIGLYMLIPFGVLVEPTVLSVYVIIANWIALMLWSDELALVIEEDDPYQDVSDLYYD